MNRTLARSTPNTRAAACGDSLITQSEPVASPPLKVADVVARSHYWTTDPPERMTTMTTTIAPTVTTSIISTPAAFAPETTWANVVDGLWVASSAGEFRGTVEFVGGRFEVTDERGTQLGRSHSLAGAKRLLDQPTPEPANVLGWSDERTVLALGWLAFGASAIAAVGIASQLFI